MSIPRNTQQQSEIGTYSIVELSDDEYNEEPSEYEDAAEDLNDLETLASTTEPVTSEQGLSSERDEFTSADDVKSQSRIFTGVKRHPKSKYSQAYQRRHAQWTKHEREVLQYVRQSEARDLTYHLLSIHGFRARQQAQKLTQSSIQDLDPDHGETTSHKLKPHGIDGWKPRSIWYRWPIPASDVPRPQSRVWYSSISKPEPLTSRRELEDNLSAFLLRTAHSQWKARAQESAQTTSKAQHKNSEQQTYDDVADGPLFSADDERSLRILQPVMTSTVSSLDRLLIAIRKSQSNTTHKRFRDDSAPHHRANTPVDWSQILGFASIINISPTAISRATTRCTAAFNENMSFNILREDGLHQPIPATQVFSPNDIHRATDPSARLGSPPPKHWSPHDGCPYTKCSWYGRRFPARKNLPRGQHSAMNRLRQHLREAHLWESEKDHPAQEEIEEEDSGMHGCVHLDGYMVPVLRALKQTQYEKPSSKRRKLESGAAKETSQDAGLASDDDDGREVQSHGGRDASSG